MKLVKLEQLHYYCFEHHHSREIKAYPLLAEYEYLFHQGLKAFVFIISDLGFDWEEEEGALLLFLSLIPRFQYQNH
jgi:hypothetical protein